MAFGALILAIGLAAPWFIIRFEPSGGALIVDGVRHTSSLQFIDIFNLRSIDISHGWVTITPYNPHLTRGVKAVEVAGIVSLVLAVGARLETLSVAQRLNPVGKFTVKVLLQFINTAAIIAFLDLMWWATVDHHFQTFAREAVYATFHGGPVGTAAAASVQAIPFIGFFITVVGLAVCAVGVYTHSSELTDAQISERRERRLAPARSAGRVIKIAVLCAIVVVALVLIVSAADIRVH